LVVVFIACPLFRQCSPVRGVCNIDDLRGADQADQADQAAQADQAGEPASSR